MFKVPGNVWTMDKRVVNMSVWMKRKRSPMHSVQHLSAECSLHRLLCGAHKLCMRRTLVYRICMYFIFRCAQVFCINLYVYNIKHTQHTHTRNPHHIVLIFSTGNHFHLSSINTFSIHMHIYKYSNSDI